jgi:hypothetical protein
VTKYCTDNWSNKNSWQKYIKLTATQAQVVMPSKKINNSKQILNYWNKVQLELHLIFRGDPKLNIFLETILSYEAGFL